MSETEVENFLEHYGVKGQKWGVRRARNGKIRARATMSKRDLDDSDWLDGGNTKAESFNAAYHKTYRNAAGKIRQGIRKVNKDPKYAKQDFRKDSPLRKEYYSEISKMATEQLNAAASRKGASPSKRFELQFDFDVSREAKPTVTVRRRDTRLGRKDARATAKESRGPSALDKTVKAVKELKHADEESATFDLVVDEMGYILDLGIPIDEAEQSDELEEFLEHYGVKGMRWGVHRSRSARRKASGKPDNGPKAKPKQASSTPKKKSVKDMTDEELKAAVQRIELERKYSQLAPSTKSKGAQAAKKFMAKNGEAIAGRFLQEAAAVAIKKALAPKK